MILGSASVSSFVKWGCLTVLISSDTCDGKMTYIKNLLAQDLAGGKCFEVAVPGCGHGGRVALECDGSGRTMENKEGAATRQEPSCTAQS